MKRMIAIFALLTTAFVITACDSSPDTVVVRNDTTLNDTDFVVDENLAVDANYVRPADRIDRDQPVNP